MRSVSLPARIAFALFGPRTNRIASAMLLFPEPFGPVIDVYPWRKGTEIFRPNDLKFSSGSLSGTRPHLTGGKSALGSTATTHPIYFLLVSDESQTQTRKEVMAIKK